MAFNSRAYSTLQYEVGAISDTAATILPPGTACKITKLPQLSPKVFTEQYSQVSAVGVGEDVHGVVKAETSLSDTSAGRLVLMNAGFIPVLLNANLKKGDYLKPVASGKWDKAMAGDQSFAKLVEDGLKDGLAWARPIEVKI